MKKIIFVIFIGLLSFSLVSDSLNLVEIQKKEKKRRKKLEKSKYVLTNDKMVEFSLTKSKSFVEADVEIATDGTKAAPKKKSPDEKNTEEYWRGRLNALNKSIENLTSKVSETESLLNRESSNFLIASTPSLQQQIKNNIDSLSKQLEEYKAGLKQKISQRDDFFTEARKSGALPGWLR